MSAAAWLSRVADEPRFVEARSLLLAGAPVVAAGNDAVLILERDKELGALVGSPEPRDLTRAAGEARLAHVLVQEEAEEAATAALPAWDVERAGLYTLSPQALASWADDEVGVRVLPVRTVAPLPGAEPAPPWAGALDHVPPALRTELVRANRRVPIFCAVQDGLLVSFAYAAGQTETLADVSVDTLAPWRGRGLAARASRALVRWIAASGRRPVWGALETNAASRRVAARLGFLPCGALLLFSRDRLA